MCCSHSPPEVPPTGVPPVTREGRSCPGRPPPGDLHRAVMASCCWRPMVVERWCKNGAFPLPSGCVPGIFASQGPAASSPCREAMAGATAECRGGVPRRGPGRRAEPTAAADRPRGPAPSTGPESSHRGPPAKDHPPGKPRPWATGHHHRPPPPPPPPPATTTAHQHRPGARTKSPQASRKAEKQAIGCLLRMPSRLKDPI
jgi:hypothetical protein